MGRINKTKQDSLSATLAVVDTMQGRLIGPSESAPPRPPRNMKSLSIHVPARQDEDTPALPYAAGPVQILPHIWLGSEDNARDWPALRDRGIAAVLNVAKEVSYPPPPHYLKLNWSHGQRDLVSDGFPTAMAFVDAALQRSHGVLIQCVPSPPPPRPVSPPPAASAASPAPRPSSSPSSCVPPRPAPPPSPLTSGSSPACRLHTPL